jgi:hypothetical protein
MDEIAPATITARERKRKWFREKYSLDKETSSSSSNVQCKFFSTSGRCRNGDECPFVHSNCIAEKKKIEQPCRYLYMKPFSCNKGPSCHFSHDLSSFPCPHSNSDPGGQCFPQCKFDHSPLLNESDRMRFVETFHSLLVSKGNQLSPKWSFYLSEYTEEQIWEGLASKSPSSCFNVPVGRLGRADWAGLH